MAAAATPRRRLEANERRELILNAARSEFTHATYSEVSIASIAEHAGVSSALVHHYGGSKAELYELVVREAIDSLAERQRQAKALLPEGSPFRDRARAGIFAFLDYIAEHPATWSAPLLGGEEPTSVTRLRYETHQAYVADLAEKLGTRGWPRHDYALHGFFSFVERACLAWVLAGCPKAHRDAVADASLGALEGALGDWGA